MNKKKPFMASQVVILVLEDSFCVYRSRHLQEIENSSSSSKSRIPKNCREVCKIVRVASSSSAELLSLKPENVKEKAVLQENWHPRAAASHQKHIMTEHIFMLCKDLRHSSYVHLYTLYGLTETILIFTPVNTCRSHWKSKLTFTGARKWRKQTLHY